MGDSFATVDIRAIGDKELERKLRRLEAKAEKKVIRPALRKSAKRLKVEVLQRVPVATGAYKAAVAAQKIKSAGKRGLIQVGLTLPTREELGISPGDKYFWPAAVEYGHRTPGGGRVGPRSHYRAAVDENYDRELRAIGTDIGRGIEREAMH